MTRRPLPRTFDAIAAVLVVQAHLAALLVAVRSAGDYRWPAVALELLAASLVLPLGCVAFARRRGGDLPGPVFALAGAGLLAVDVALAAVMRPDRVGAPSLWTAVAIGVTVLALCPFRPPRDLVVLAAAHATVIAVVLALHRDSATVVPFAVIVDLSAAVVPAVAGVDFASYFVRAAQRRADAVAEQARAQWQLAAGVAVAEDADRRLARLRAEVLPLLEDVASGRRAVDDPDVAELARRLSADLRRELVEARTGAWVLAAPADVPVPPGSGGPRRS